MRRPTLIKVVKEHPYPRMAKPTLHGVSFSVSRGEIFGLLGPSGAGKSTLLKLLTRQERHFGGTVQVLGKPLPLWGRDFFEAIGVGFELPNHYVKFRAVENLRFFASLYRRKSRDPMELLASVGLKEAAHKKVEAFSKGMRMRLNFVRAIQHDPDILFLDEPTAGLDPVNAGTIKRLIAKLRSEGKTARAHVFRYDAERSNRNEAVWVTDDNRRLGIERRTGARLRAIDVAVGGA